MALSINVTTTKTATRLQWLWANVGDWGHSLTSNDTFAKAYRFSGMWFVVTFAAIGAVYLTGKAIKHG